MTRTENDLRDALRELEQRADRQGGPTAANILNATGADRLGGTSARRRSTRWLAPLAAAAVVAAALAGVALSTQPSGSSHPRTNQAGSRTAGSQAAASATDHPTPSPSATTSTPTTSTPTTSTPSTATSAATAVLDDAAATLSAAPKWTAPAPSDYFYVRTTQATTWTSVSGTRAGDAHTASGGRIWVPGCKNGQFVAGSGQSGSCTLNDVAHYLKDAPTTPQAWDSYLETMAPGSKAADAQGKIIVQVLYQDLIAPKAAAALLRYTTSCPGLHTLALRPVDGEKLIGVTCTSMANGSYALAFDATSHAFVGFSVVTAGGQQDGPAEVVRQTGIVPTIGRTP
jgi:hypothetical protein